jgi:hypothetical protein
LTLKEVVVDHVFQSWVSGRVTFYWVYQNEVE